METKHGWFSLHQWNLPALREDKQGKVKQAQSLFIFDRTVNWAVLSTLQNAL